MITLPKRGTVYEITDSEVKVPELRTTDSFPNSSGATTKREQFTAPSSSVLVHVTERELQLVVGRAVSNATVRNVLGFAITNKKPVVLLKCEALSNLQLIDRMVVLANETITQMDPNSVDL